MTTSPVRRAAGVLAVAALLAACGHDPAEQPATTPHGYVEGAEETAEAQSRLVVADASTGAAHVLDLITEQVTPVGTVEGAHAITGDGRFGYLTGRADGVRVIDSGAWMVDHGDHVHYYRAAVREAGTAPGQRLLAAYSDPAVTALSFPDGTAKLLDRAKLDRGSIAELGTIARSPHPGVAVPYRERVLASVADGVRVHDRQGKQVAEIGQPCPELSGAAVTRRGVVFGCADGALLVTEKDGTFAGEKITYPRPVGKEERASRFAHRPGSTTLAAAAGTDAVWALDVRARKWSRIETGPVAALNAVGEDAPVLVLTRDGVLRAFDPGSGAQQAQVPLLPAVSGPVAPAIQVDATRAYVNNPSSGEIYEIDYNDHLRRARTLTVPGKASYVVETGR
ncbi:hypothetical protein [Amycolatopsis nivea]|uniref:hypothetical protein n=1 Tax=Amycolatopsis nivea TaxID=1644109 RepID=UPI00106F635F|nr:hypothetical protein [Amycolatopsis nivea]